MTQQKKKINKNVIWTLISLLLAVLTIRIVLKQNSEMSLNELIEVISGSDKKYMIAAMVSALLYIVFEAQALGVIINRAGCGRVRLNGILYSASDMYFSAITPSSTGGQPASAFFMMLDGISGGIATAALILNILMYTLSIITLGFVSAFIMPEAFGSFSTVSKVFIIGGFIILSGLSAVSVVLLKKDSLIFRPLTAIINKLYEKKIIRQRDSRIARLEKIRNDYRKCSDIISNSKRILFYTFFLNLIQRVSQIIVPVLVYNSLGGKSSESVSVFIRQCLITIGFNYVPVPGGMGISDYLMIDGFTEIMVEKMAYSVELISRGITFYICVLISGLITLVGYCIKRRVSPRFNREEQK